MGWGVVWRSGEWRANEGGCGGGGVCCLDEGGRQAGRMAGREGRVAGREGVVC